MILKHTMNHRWKSYIGQGLEGAARTPVPSPSTSACSPAQKPPTLHVRDFCGGFITIIIEGIVGHLGINSAFTPRAPVRLDVSALERLICYPGNWSPSVVT